MGWEFRGNRGLYYYQKERRGDRVISSYVGNGPVAEYADSLNRLERHQRNMERYRLDQARQDERQARAQLDRHRSMVRDYLAAILPYYGAYQHKRQWRRRRMDLVEHDLMGRAAAALKEGDAKTFSALVKECPGVAMVADLTGTIEAGFVDRVAGSDKAMQKALQVQCDLRRKDLGIEGAPHHEKMLIHEIVLTWLHLKWCEYQLARVTGRQLEFWDGRTSAAQRRHLRAIESLARVRKLNLSLVQVNIGQQEAPAIMQ